MSYMSRDDREVPAIEAKGADGLVTLALGVEDALKWLDAVQDLVHANGLSKYLPRTFWSVNARISEAAWAAQQPSKQCDEPDERGEFSCVRPKGHEDEHRADVWWR